MRSTLQRTLTNQTFTTGASPQLVSYQQTDYTYDGAGVSAPNSSRGFLTQITNTWNYKDAGGNWQSKLLVGNTYAYDNAGQRLTNTLSSLDAGGNPISRVETYGYDELNRVSTVNYGDGQTQSYTFDAMGNRLSKTDAGGGLNGTETYGYNNANMLLTRAGNAYTNDADGNTLTGGGRTNAWDSQNRMVSCAYNGNTSTFTYGTDGIRHRSVVNGTATDYVLDASMFVRELSGGSSKATYFMGPSGPAYRRDDVSTAVRWYLYDGLGSVLGEVDPNGNITATRKYDVYGAIRSSTGTSTSKHKFVGQLGHPSEDETGLTYMRARYYDPQVGRFASQDPKKDGNNWFAYCGADPVNNVDDTGKALNRWMNEFWIVLAELLGAVGIGEVITLIAMPLFNALLAFAGTYGAIVGAGLTLLELSLSTMLAAVFAAAALVAVLALVLIVAYVVASMVAAYVVSSWEGIDSSNTGNFEGPGWFGNDPNPKPNE